MDLLTNTIRPYAWGSRTAIAELQGREPADAPEAELWMGAHPGAPSRMESTQTLLDAIEADPAGELGERVVETFGPRLPYLLKVLAADLPLSLQVHPTPEQARAGWDAEEAAGVPRDAGHRNYKDPYAKPELIVALTPFVGLCGFRAVPELTALLAELDLPALEPLRDQLCEHADGTGLEAVLASLLEWPAEQRGELVTEVAKACREVPDSSTFAESCHWAAAVADDYPDDTGVVVMLMLNLITLQPGEALFLRPRTFHAYLRGVGVEIMAGSDNVLRGGLTPKHIDVPELLATLDFTDGPVELVATTQLSAYEKAWLTPTPEFRLSQLTPGAATVELAGGLPQILVCTSGSAQVSDASRTIALTPGESVFVPATSSAVTIAGDATLFRAIPGL